MSADSKNDVTVDLGACLTSKKVSDPFTPSHIIRTPTSTVCNKWYGTFIPVSKS